MKVSEALETRLTVRGFLDKPVPADTVRSILETAKRAPSGGNLQPWHVYVVSGDALVDLKAQVQARIGDHPAGEGTEYHIYPPNLSEPYRTRRFRIGEQMFATVGIGREDKFARLMQFARNFDMFGASTGLFFAIDRQMQEGQWADLGMFMQSVMLLAREHGLDTCPQEAWAIWHKTVGAFLKIPENLMLFCGMGIGYRDPDHPMNSLRSERAPLEEFTTFVG